MPFVNYLKNNTLTQEDHLRATNESDANRQLPLLAPGEGFSFLVFLLREPDVQQGFLQTTEEESGGWCNLSGGIS